MGVLQGVLQCVLQCDLFCRCVEVGVLQCVLRWCCSAILFSGVGCRAIFFVLQCVAVCGGVAACVAVSECSVCSVCCRGRES